MAKAEQELSQYLKLRPKDGPVWQWYARLMDERDVARGRLSQIFLVYEEALRHNPDDTALERRCADLALELAPLPNGAGRYNDAQRHLSKLLTKVSKDSKSESAPAQLAELEEKLGQCNRELTRYRRCRGLVSTGPGTRSWAGLCYDRLARLHRVELRRIGEADSTVERMVAKNPTAAMAYVYRWRYPNAFDCRAQLRR